MLNELLKQYSATKILFEVEGKDSTQESVQILKQIEAVLKKSEWKITSSSVENYSMAMMAFFEMSVRKIGGDIPALLCYYYSSLVANDSSLSVNIRANGYRFRAFVEFKNMDKWNIILSMAQAPFNGYDGNLTESEFFDILLLSDVYNAWGSDPSSSMLANLQKQAPKVAALHPSFSRSKVLSEGELAHKAVFDVIEPIVKIV